MERTRCLMVLVFVLVFGLTAGTANAAEIAVEEFDYPVGEDLLGQNGGTGWTGPWTPEEQGGTATIQAVSLAHTTVLLPVGRGGHVLTGTSGEAMLDRILVTPILDAGGPGQAWVSYLFTVETTPIDEDNWRSLELFSGSGWAAYITGTGQPWGAGTFGFFDVDSDVPITVGQVYWIVVKIEFSGDGADDDVYLWVDPDPGSEPDTASPTVSTTTSTADNGLRRVAIVSMGPGRWDRIRIATTWVDCFGFSPKLASSPQPANDAINVDPTLALLQWQAPTEVVSPLHDVYFGTYGDDDPNFTIANTQLEDNTANTSTDPTPVGDLAIDTQYYWRVDVNDPNGDFPPEGILRKGSIWTFRTWPWEPIILTQPENTLVLPGGTAEFEVVSGGNVGGSHTYQWYHYVNPGVTKIRSNIASPEVPVRT